METCGLGVDMRICRKAQSLLHRKLRELEAQGEKLAGMKFSLSAPAEVAHVLYRHLNLPVPPGCKGKHHPSTDKQALDFLRYNSLCSRFILNPQRTEIPGLKMTNLIDHILKNTFFQTRPNFMSPGS